MFFLLPFSLERQFIPFQKNHLGTLLSQILLLVCVVVVVVVLLLLLLVVVVFALILWVLFFCSFLLFSFFGFSCVISSSCVLLILLLLADLAFYILVLVVLVLIGGFSFIKVPMNIFLSELLLSLSCLCFIKYYYPSSSFSLGCCFSFLGGVLLFCVKLFLLFWFFSSALQTFLFLLLVLVLCCFYLVCSQLFLLKGMMWSQFWFPKLHVKKGRFGAVSF